ncbi:hypothetical protein [Alloalcanivorax gelatiniphagus]|uniref:Prenyltransferase n=1 Tax=Alloalcanivorax gelatiniphagus TaxID=1194167 RepID=A0ABY2XMK7_9GAMM|nr:hypothetical protein [Alloalcanivorax gelatiniphagus]TMW13627.1 hypothetical protein FGS76_05715 [Alloalcanivorax gelatiniphagus]
MSFYLLPFSYFYQTRLKEGSIAFHVIFEWIAALWLVVWIGDGVTVSQNIFALFLNYIAFISIYEIGYMANDIYAAKYEKYGRHRGPQGARNLNLWVCLWVVIRLATFLACTIVMNKFFDASWWLFFFALILVFSLHNLLNDREMKAATFSWLAWFRFMAPVIFVISKDQLMSVGLAVAFGYVAYRKLGYMDSKGLLLMPGRKRTRFRLFFFLSPMAGAVALWPYGQAQGYLLLVVYWAAVSSVGAALTYKFSRPSQ